MSTTTTPTAVGTAQPAEAVVGFPVQQQEYPVDTPQTQDVDTFIPFVHRPTQR